MLRFDSLLEILPPMLLGTIMLLTLILLKGDICPGQRGRIHKMLPVIAVGWLVASIGSVYLLAPSALLLFYFSRVKTGKTRGSGPLAVLISVNVLAGLGFVIQLIGASSWLAAFTLLLLMVLLGASMAHFLLVIARTRLQAFHKLLPVAGILSAMCVSLCLIPYGNGLSEAELELSIASILFSFIVLMAAIVVWVWPVLFAKAPTKAQLGITSLMLLVSSNGFFTLLSI